jgi:hypothetical protein
MQAGNNVKHKVSMCCVFASVGVKAAARRRVGRIALSEAAAFVDAFRKASAIGYRILCIRCLHCAIETRENFQNS